MPKIELIIRSTDVSDLATGPVVILRAHVRAIGPGDGIGVMLTTEEPSYSALKTQIDFIKSELDRVLVDAWAKFELVRRPSPRHFL